MQQLDCATCRSSPLRAPQLVGEVWYALCAQCLFETEVEALGGSVDAVAAFRVKGVAGVSPQQEADLRRPIPLA